MYTLADTTLQEKQADK